MTTASTTESYQRIKALIFDVDDTLYDIQNGFTDDRNGRTIQSFMVEKLGFPDRATAKALRDEYFAKYHSSMKALTVAQQEGRFIYGKEFRSVDLNEYFASNCKFSLLTKDEKLIEILTELKEKSSDDKEGIKVIAFSNGPRKYVLKVLDVLGLSHVFTSDCVWAVDDTLPHCKPEKEAFETILQKISSGACIKFEECVMVEDSMKNIKAAKKLGMKTILITGSSVEAHHDIDRPNVEDSAVDIYMESANEIKEKVPGMWNSSACWKL